MDAQRFAMQGGLGRQSPPSVLVEVVDDLGRDDALVVAQGVAQRIGVAGA